MAEQREISTNPKVFLFKKKKKSQLAFAQLLPGNQHLLSNYYILIIMLDTARGIAPALNLGRQAYTQEYVRTQILRKLVSHQGLMKC